jgi:copper transport protein
MIRRLSFFLLITLLLSAAWPVSAHGYIVRSIPEDRSSLERPPARLQYWFSEALEAKFSAINLRDDRGNILATGGVDEQDETLLSLQVPQDLSDGAYIVELRPAFASDGHVVIESRVFFVGETVGGIEGQAADDSARPLEIIWKALLYNASYLLFGTVMLYNYVLVPVWGNPRYLQGLLPPRVMYRLNLIMWIGIFVTAYAHVIALMQQTMVFFGVDLDLVLEGGLWEVVRIGSRFGDIWNFRMLVLVLIFIMHTASIYYRERFPKVVRSFWTANSYLLALFIGAHAVNSHIAGSLVMPWVGMAIHWLHTMAVAFWVGGIMALTLVLPVALQPYEGVARWQALQAFMRRFSRYIVGAVLVVIASGLYSASNWFFSPNDLFTSYGTALGYKIVMIALLLFLGGLHHMALRPHLLEKVPFQGLVHWAKNFGLSIRLETLLAIITLIMAALLSSTPIPEPDFLQQTYETPTANRRVGDYEVQMTMAPGAPGINSVDVTVRRNVLLVDDVTTQVQFVAPERDFRSDWHHAEPVDQGLYAFVNDSIDRTGYWLALVDVIDGEGRLTRIVFSWQISEDAGILNSISPSILTILAAFTTLASVLFVVYPAGRHLAAKMDWSLTNIIISTGLIAITIIAIVASWAFLDNQGQEIELQQNPAPQSINTVVPDAASIAIGGVLFEQHCDWRNQALFEDFIYRLPTVRDEDIYHSIKNGWRSLAACDESLTDNQHWHIVNHLRTLRHSSD